MLKLMLKTDIKGIENDLTIGKDYEIFKPCGGWGDYLAFNTDNDIECSFNPTCFETLIQNFERKVKESGAKFIVSKPGGQYIKYTVELQADEKHFFVYSHSKGTHWNISGNHSGYVHDINTGEYLPNTVFSWKPLLRERILMADFTRLDKIALINRKNLNV